MWARERIIVNACVESESLVALDKQTGKEVWRAEGIRESWNTPVLVEVPGGKTELVVESLGQLLGFDPATGERLWNCSNGHGDYVCPSVVAHEGIVYSLGGRSGRGMAVRAGGRGDVSQTHLVWKGTKGSPNVPSPVYDDGHLYFADEDHIARCLDAKTGAIVYEQRLKGRSFGDASYPSPVLADGKLYYVSFNGRTLVLAATPEFQQLATNDLGEGGGFKASPAVSGGRLLTRSDRFLYCIGQK
jgi:outer membrane protein assembly factor BamB